MADVIQVIETLAGAGVFGFFAKGSGRLWTKLIDKPLEKAEARNVELEEKLEKSDARADYFERKYHELAGEVKAAAITSRSIRRLDEIETGVPLSAPPPPMRNELPTIDAMIDLRQDAAYAFERERSRQRPLNSPESVALPLEALGGKIRLPPDAGREDYREHDRDRMSRGYDTPVQAFRPKQPTLREDDTPPDGIAAKAKIPRPRKR